MKILEKGYKVAFKEVLDSAERLKVELEVGNRVGI